MADRKIDTGIVQRGNNYRFTVAMGMNKSGKQIRKTMTWKAPEGITQKKADKLAKEQYLIFKEKCENGHVGLDENMRFSELVELYFQIHGATLKPSSVYNSRKQIDIYYMEYFGNKKLKDIKRPIVQDFFRNLHGTDSNGNPIKFKEATLKRYFTSFRSLFSFAVEEGYIGESPCETIRLPKDTEADEESEKKRMYLTEYELPEFLELFEDYSSFNTIIKLLLYTGMRSGECLGLQWCDIDFQNRIISVNHTLSDAGGKHTLVKPKSKTSKRQIAMSNTVYELLKEHRTEQMKLQFAIGSSFLHPEMVFTSATGNYKDRSVLLREYKNHLKNTKFDFMTLHCLRHSNATLLLNSGVDIKIVSEHLGHSDIGITASVYADVLESSKRKTAEIIEFKLKEAN